MRSGLLGKLVATFHTGPEPTSMKPYFREKRSLVSQRDAVRVTMSIGRSVTFSGRMYDISRGGLCVMATSAGGVPKSGDVGTCEFTSVGGVRFEVRGVIVRWVDVRTGGFMFVGLDVPSAAFTSSPLGDMTV